MTAIGIKAQFLQVAQQFRPQRVQMNKSNQFRQIIVFLTDDGFVPVLEKLAMTIVSSVVGISGKQPFHQTGDTGWTGSEQKPGEVEQK